MPRLKVFRTTSGFYDHIVAAPSRPAALKAWGARTDLFSMGVAQQVSDPKIEEKALKRPGEVIRLKRSGEEAPTPRRKPKRKGAPPSRAKLKEAEERLTKLLARQEKEMSAAERELEAIKKKRSRLATRHKKAAAAAEDKVEREREAYQAKLDDWPG